MAAASGLRPSAWVASVSGVAGLPSFDVELPVDDFVEIGAFLPLGGGVFGLTDVAPCAGSTFGVGIREITRSGDGCFGAAGFLDAAFVGAAFFVAAFFIADFFVAVFFVAADDFFTADFFVAAFLPAAADFFGSGFVVFFATGLVTFFDAAFAAFFATGLATFFAVIFFAGDFFGDVLVAVADFLVAGFAAVAGFFFFFASAASFDVADLLALDDLAFAVLPAAFFAAGLAVDAFDFGDGRFMVNSYGRWTSLRGAARSTGNNEHTTRVLMRKTSQRMKDTRCTCRHGKLSGGPFSSIVLPSGSSRYMDGPSPWAP